MSKVSTRRRPQPAPQTFFTRRASVPAASFNAATGSFSAVIATETPVLRRDFNGEYLEVLSVKPGAVRLARLQSGAAPLLDSHRAGSTRDQIGIVAGAHIENSQLVIDGRLSSRDDVKPIAADLAGGTPPNVSVGYRVYASAESRTPDGMLVITRTDWEPFEASFTPIPADPKTHVRKGNVMDPEDQTLESETRNDIDTEHARRADIDDDPPARTMSDRHARQAYDIAARAGLSAEFARQHIDDGVTLKAFRTLVINRKADEADRTATSNLSPGYGSRESLADPDFLGRAIEGVLYARMAGKAPEGAATELMGRSMIDMGAMLMEARGERVSWAKRDQIASRMLTRDLGGMHSTSDFPNLLTGAGNRILLDSYKTAECPLKALAKRRDATDFRAISLLRLSEAARLSEVKEGGEVTYGSRSETKEGFAVKTYAKIFSLSRQAIINDDLGAFADSNVAWGRAAAETEADLLVGLFTANSGNGMNLDDGNALYTTVRGNKAATGGSIGETTFSDARLAMRQTKGLDGKTPISVTPKHLVVGAAKETEAEKVLAAITAAKTSDVNPFAGKVTLHVEPRFTGNAWRLFADPAEISTIVIAYLNGNAGPILHSREGWSTLGAEFRAVLDFGCGLTEWRGTYLNPGD
jgi:hypothetical protein